MADGGSRLARPGRPASPAVAARRERVADLAARGLRQVAIADALDVQVSTVHNDLAVLRRRGDPRVPAPMDRDAAYAVGRDRAAAKREAGR